MHRKLRDQVSEEFRIILRKYPTVGPPGLMEPGAGDAGATIPSEAGGNDRDRETYTPRESIAGDLRRDPCPSLNTPSVRYDGSFQYRPARSSCTVGQFGAGHNRCGPAAQRRP